MSGFVIFNNAWFLFSMSISQYKKMIYECDIARKPMLISFVDQENNKQMFEIHFYLKIIVYELKDALFYGA